MQGTSLLIFRLFFLSTLLIILGACENDEKDIKVWTQNKPLIEKAIRVESYLSQEGKMKAKLTAPLMYHMVNDTGFVEFPKTLHVDFFDTLGKKETELDCLYAKYFENKGLVYLRDSVRVVTTKGDTLRSPDLWWDQNKAIFYTDKYATYKAPDRNIIGNTGLEATQDLKTVTFKDPTARIKSQNTGL